MGINSSARRAAVVGAAVLVVGATFAPTAGATMGDHLLDFDWPERNREIDVSGTNATTLNELYGLAPCLEVTVRGGVNGDGTAFVRPMQAGLSLDDAMIASGVEGSISGLGALEHPLFPRTYLVDGEHPLFVACTRAEYEASTSTTSTSTSTTVPASTTSPATTSPATTGPVDTGPVDTDLATTTTDAEGLGATTTAPGSLPVTGRSTATGWALAVLAGGIALVVGTTRRTT